MIRTLKSYTDVLKDVVVLLPALHLSVCFIYLYLYFAAFGGSLALFTSPADVFSVSFANIAPFYAGLLIQPTIFLMPIVWNMEAPDKAIEQKKSGFCEKFLYIAPVVIGLVGGALYYYVTEFFPASWILFAFFMGSYWFIRTYINRKRRPVKVIFLSALALAMIFLSFKAITDGQRDRYAALDKFQSNARCKQYVVLRSLGDRFLAVDAEGRRFMIDDTCEPRFLIGSPNPKYFPDYNVAELLRRVRSRLRF